MAIDLLRTDPPVHMYRHDLESMFYVLVWITSRFHYGEEIADPPFQDWVDHSRMDLVEKKRSFLIALPLAPTPEFKPLEQRWVVPMRKVIRGGLSARDDYLLEKRAAENSD